MLRGKSRGRPAGLDYQVNAALELPSATRRMSITSRSRREGASALHVSTLHGGDRRAAPLQHDFAFTTGGAWSRNQLFLRLAGEGTMAGIRGATLLSGRQHVDTTMVVDHAVGRLQKPRTVQVRARRRKPRGVPGQDHRAARRRRRPTPRWRSHALLLSENAEADSKPELEIFADDVLCGHGATAGRARRGAAVLSQRPRHPPKEAEALLIQAFIGEAIEGIEHAGLREALIEATAAMAGGTSVMKA